MEMPREHLAESSRNNKGVSLTRVCPGSRRREWLVWWWKRDQLCSWAATAAVRYSSFEAETVAATEASW